MFSGKRLDTVSEVSPMASQRLPCTSMLATAYCNRLDQFCAQLQNNCSSLLSIAKVKPKPESRGYNFAIFLEDLNDDISSALTELTHLEERTTDTLSFEELLVHCDALYESNEDGIRKLELQLQQYGYAPDEPVSSVHPSLQKLTFVESPTNEDARISLRDAEMEDNLNTKYGSDWFPESKKKAPPPPSESDSRLISTQRNAEVCSNPLVHNKPKSEHGDGATNATPTTSTPIRDENFQSLDTKKVPSLNEISSVQYDHLPLWLKSQVSFEEVNAAVTKINELIRQRGTQGEHANQFFLDQKDVQSLELGAHLIS
uniref:Spindle and kinetochore-associated protein 3 n=1 Tax=Physcomitrium patens TaxID=3218 RepID=A0A7I4DKP0_PHYPA